MKRCITACLSAPSEAKSSVSRFLSLLKLQRLSRLSTMRIIPKSDIIFQPISSQTHSQIRNIQKPFSSHFQPILGQNAICFALLKPFLVPLNPLSLPALWKWSPRIEPAKKTGPKIQRSQKMDFHHLGFCLIQQLQY